MVPLEQTLYLGLIAPCLGIGIDCIPKVPNGNGGFAYSDKPTHIQAL